MSATEAEGGGVAIDRFLGVNDVVGTNPSFLFGPFNLRGNKQLPSTAPLGFHTAADARRIQFGLKVVF